jgi:hypothetical protein
MGATDDLLPVDFDHKPCCRGACGFRPTVAGVLDLQS